MDVSKTIIPKSDQLNADDLLTGPITVKILGVSEGPSDQPLHLKIDGGKQPYKPCKSMRRVLVFAWGKFADQWVGRSMTLFCDPGVKWAGEPVGGIRISHLSDIPQDITAMLTLTKGIKKPYLVKKMTGTAADLKPNTITEEQAAQLAELFDRLPEENREPFMAWVAKSHEGPLNTLPPHAFDKVLGLLKKGVGE